MAETLINQKKTQWTEEKVNKLKQLLADGEATTKIAATLGTTRNAVIGKVARSGWALSGCQARKPAVKQHRPRLTIYRTYAAFAPGYEMSDQETKVQELSTSESCSILDLTTNTCHWPLWSAQDEPDKQYCGAPSSGRVYCEQHAAKAIQIRRPAANPRPFLLSSKPR